MSKILSSEKAGYSLFRQAWGWGQVGRNLTPARLASLMLAAEEGDPIAMLTLLEEIEERDLHFRSVMSTRKLAVESLTVLVNAADDSASAMKLADAVKSDIVGNRTFSGLKLDLLDALAKGFSVVEMIWDTSRKPWRPEFKWRDPRFFLFDQEDPHKIRLLDEADPAYGIELPPYKFVVHVPKLKSGIPLRGGLGKVAAYAWMCKTFGLDAWAQFLDTYGVPLRIGRYQPGAKDDEKEVLRQAVYDLTSGGAGILPEGMSIEIIQPGQTASVSGMFEGFANFLNKEMSKAVLGQTMTTEDGGSKSQAEVHEEVRQDLVESDARQLAETLNRDVVEPYIDLNFGVQDAYPVITIPVPEKHDLLVMASTLKELVPLGLKVDMGEVRERLGFAKPADGAELLGTQIEN